MENEEYLKNIKQTQKSLAQIGEKYGKKVARRVDHKVRYAHDYTMRKMDCKEPGEWPCRSFDRFITHLPYALRRCHCTFENIVQAGNERRNPVEVYSTTFYAELTNQFNQK